LAGLRVCQHLGKGMKTDKEILRYTGGKVRELAEQLDEEVSDHLYYMLNNIVGMEDTRKANRWLGFIHGTLVALTDCTIDELRDSIR
jgi:hypothetical protein